MAGAPERLSDEVEALDDGPPTLDVIDAIFTTGAERRLRPDPIPDWLIWNILDAAIRGPSGGNRQRWGWVVVSDPDTKALIGSHYLEAWNALGSGRRARLSRFARQLVGRPPLDPADAARNDPNYRSGEHLANNIAKAPVWVFAVVCDIRGAPSVADGADIFGAVQNLMLAARKYGLGTTLTMLHLMERDESVNTLLGLPRDARALALIPIGFPVSGRSVANRRRPVETVTHWDRWGSQRTRTSLPVDAST